jgi:uncharacterized membrane protein
MSRQSASIEIDRPAIEVFAYMDDIHLEREWQPNLQSAEQDPPGPTTVGTRKRYVSRFLGREVENTYVVTELEPGRRVVYETERGSTLDARSEIVCEPTGTGTIVTMLIDGKPKGVLRFVPAKVLEAASRDELDATLRRLKERLETGHGPQESA